MRRKPRIYLGGSRITLREIQPPVRIQGDHPWKAEFVRALAREDLSPLTVQGYAGDVGMFLRWYAPNKLENLSGIDLIHYRQHLAGEKGLRPATLNRRLEAMRRFCRWAHEEKKLKINVATEVKLARTSRGIRPKGLEDPEVQTLLRAAGQSGPWTGQAQLCLDPTNASDGITRE